MTAPFPDAAERYEAFRVHVWSCSIPAVRGGRLEFGKDELEIQARWFGGEFGRSFRGCEGEAIEVVQFGHWNRGAGPDFTEAAIRVDGQLRKGAVEIDLDVRNWERHGHHENPAFNGVVLHVFADQPALKRVFTRTAAHGNIVQLLLPQFSGLQGPPDFLPQAFPGRCLAPLGLMREDEVSSLLAAAAQYRLRIKSERLRVMRESTSAEQAMFQALAEALGFRRNKTPMAVLAQRCPLRSLLEIPAPAREAWLFGAAGFLDPVDGETAAAGTRAYLRRLWDEWWKLRDQVEVIPRRAIPWHAEGTRPLNHPQRRIGALAGVLERWGSIRRLWDEPVDRIEQHVNNWSKTLQHPFWNRHFTLRSEALAKPIRLIGRDRLRDILGNVVFPGLIKHRPELWPAYARLGGVDSNQKLRRAVLRLFGPDRERQKLFTRYYHQQQGLLQIFEDFCLEDASDCHECPFPEQLRQWRSFEGGAGPSSPTRPSRRTVSASSDTRFI